MVGMGGGLSACRQTGWGGVPACLVQVVPQLVPMMEGRSKGMFGWCTVRFGVMAPDRPPQATSSEGPGLCARRGRVGTVPSEIASPRGADPRIALSVDGPPLVRCCSKGRGERWV